LTHTRFAPCTEVQIYLADVLCPEEVRSASLLNIPLVGSTITITITHAYNIRGYSCPNAVYQPFLIILAKDPLGFLLVKHLQG